MDDTPPTPDYQQILRAVVMATKSSNQLPKLGDKYEVLSSHSVFAKLMTVEGQRIRDLVGKLLKMSGVKASFAGGNSDDLMEQLVDCNDTLLEKIGNHLDEAMGVRKAAEPLLIQSSIDSNKIASVTAWNRGSVGSVNGGTGTWDRSIDYEVLPFSPTLCSSMLPNSNSTPIGNIAGGRFPVSRTHSGSSFVPSPGTQGRVSLICSKNLPRPQLQFLDLIDNSNNPFVPRLKLKHNALAVRASHADGNVTIVDEEAEMGSEEFIFSSDVSASKLGQHPYLAELSQLDFDQFLPSVPGSHQSASFPVPPPVEETPLKLVSTLSDLEMLRDHLNRQRCFAVDVENHSYRTFQGLACLLQITTVDASLGQQDFIVDTLALWRHVGMLNEPFTNSNILKVFHGAEFDIEWLQRDFGIYVVGMFDTGQAMRLLAFPKFSLAYLLKRMLDITVNKEFQLADWRIRPLPQPMVDYARSDTHYLLCCFDRLRRQLVDASNEGNNLFRIAFERSRDICLRQYQKPLFTETAHLELIKKRGQRGKLNPRQMLALKQLYAWRDATARREDESIHYVLPNVALLSIAEKLPREAQGILACCNPVPPLVKQDLTSLHQIIYNARSCELKDQGMLEAPVLGKVVKMYGGGELGQDIGFPRRQLNPLLHACHDFTHTDEGEEIGGSEQLRQDALMDIDSGNCGSLPKILIDRKSSPNLKIFSTDDTLVECPDVEKLKNEGNVVDLTTSGWMSPYEKYKLSLERRGEALAELEMIKQETEELFAPGGNRTRGHGVEPWSAEAQDEEIDILVVKERVVVKKEPDRMEASEEINETPSISKTHDPTVASRMDESTMPPPNVIPKPRHSFQSPAEPSEEYDSVRNRIRREQALKRMFDGPSPSSSVKGSLVNGGLESELNGAVNSPGTSSGSGPASDENPSVSGKKKVRKVVKLEPFDYEEAKRELNHDIQRKSIAESNSGASKKNKKNKKRLVAEGGGSKKKSDSMKHLRVKSKEKSISYKD